MRKAKEVVCKEVGGKGFLLHLGSGAYFEVNPVGLQIWRACGGKVSPEGIARSVARRHRVDPRKALRDVRDFMKQLKRRRMLL